MFTGLIVLSSKCMTLNSPSKSVLRIFILISIEGPSLSPYKGSSLHTSRSTISSVSRDSFHFYSGMMASDMGFFNIASCIHYAPQVSFDYHSSSKIILVFHLNMYRGGHDI